LTIARRARSNTRPFPGGQVAQLVEQRTENPRVGGSIPPLATNKINAINIRRTIYAMEYLREHGIFHGSLCFKFANMAASKCVLRISTMAIAPF
jgi:hypothetical protein